MVANETHSKYGICIYVTHLAYGHMATIAQIRVIKTKTMSIDARLRFFKPNCIGVNAKLKIKFKINGNKTKNGTCF